MSPSVRCSEDVDLVGMMFRVVRQVPPGKVTTYGDVAKALGDVRAAKAVAEVLCHCGRDDLPWHRVVDADGGVRKERGLRPSSTAARQLKDERVAIRNGRVENFAEARFSYFDVEPVLQVLRKEQEALRSSVIESDDFGVSECIAGIDVSYSGEMACAALVRVEPVSLETVEVRCATGQVRFPYIPGYLGYRELPMVRKVYREDDGDIILIDGQGVLHPRGFGIASQIGVCLGAATIGAAKSLLVGEVEGSGARAPVLVDGKVRGMRLKPKGRKEVFVSVGHRVSLETGCAVCEGLMVRGVPEPLRLAHILATRERKAREMER